MTTNIAIATLLTSLSTGTVSQVEGPESEATTQTSSSAEGGSLGHLTESDVEVINRRWSGVGVGYDNGLWGRNYGQSIKISIPFGKKLGRFMGLRVRTVFAHHNDEFNDQFDPALNVGGELFGRGPVWNGILRVYGGGGLWAGIRPNPTSEGKTVGLGGGGHFGLEVLAAPFMSFTFEIGGQAPGHTLGHDAGASAMGGVMFYFGKAEG